MAFKTVTKSYDFYRAECSCSWVGPKRKTHGKALTDKQEHINEHIAEINRHAQKSQDSWLGG